MLDVREEPAAQAAVDAACQKWPRAIDAWDAIVWALARDPFGAGPAMTESGRTRLFIFDGARSLGMPSARIVYVVEATHVTVRLAEFFDSIYPHAGHA